MVNTLPEFDRLVQRMITFIRYAQELGDTDKEVIEYEFENNADNHRRLFVPNDPMDSSYPPSILERTIRKHIRDLNRNIHATRGTTREIKYQCQKELMRFTRLHDRLVNIMSQTRRR
jgi:hypothetical protein